MTDSKPVITREGPSLKPGFHMIAVIATSAEKKALLPYDRYDSCDR